ncbi:glycosyl transferase [Clostridium diolis]|uniref:macrolide family glycosyltransferase n=1 Tax=Clostridium diolis TaxID=223919 RepID=UPI000D1177C6|nr:macrolide family glycosyltransferase [Clostridium diolis]PSM56694.1 glycosyl transferase [Clostridium diolis]
MGKILFLGMPGYGHINPTLGIIAELIKNGEKVIYFCTEEFRQRIENTGAVFKCYSEWNGIGKNKPSKLNNRNIEFLVNMLEMTINSYEKTVENILEQIEDMKFDVIGYSAMFPYGVIIAQILNVPSFSSFEVFATPSEMVPKERQEATNAFFENDPIVSKYKELSDKLNVKYNIEMPELRNLLFYNRGDINFVYTSKYFVGNTKNYDQTFKFIGPPIYDRKEDLTDFPYNEIKGKKIIYISLGTIFSNFDLTIYDIFFKAFKDVDAAVVMTAYNTDLSEFDIPHNFIIRNYISQTEILKYADVAITHSGMNSTNDLLFNNIPFVAIPIGADQLYIASKSAKLGACISLDKDKLTPEILIDSVNKVLTDPQYMTNIKKINESFKECGGYERATEEILSLKQKKLV